MAKGVTYKDAGVDIDAGNRAVDLIKQMVESTHGLGPGRTIGPLGGFSGGKELTPGGLVVTATTDGVGTKLKVAFRLGRHNTVGIDLVAMCVNDTITDGSQPLFFLDYIAQGVQVPERTEAIIAGIVDGCKQADTALVGGEMAELPGFYPDDEYDLAGFAVGIADSMSALIRGQETQIGMKVYGLPSSGLHSNGFSLARKVFLVNGVVPPSEEKARLEEDIPELGCSLGEELLRPTRIYVRPVLEVVRRLTITGMANITGGGFIDNPKRMVKDGTAVRLDPKKWPVPPIFGSVQRRGNVSTYEMRRSFNNGIGYMLISPDRVDTVIPDALLIGEIVKAPTKDTQFVGD